MHMIFECDHCAVAYQISRMDENFGLLTVQMDCPKCEEGSVQVVMDSANPPQGILAKELWLACRGRGFEDERNCCPEKVRLALLNNPVILGMELMACGEAGERSLVETLTIRSGLSETTTFHFATSTKGATIYRIEKGSVEP